jgi:hypothetical protein
MKRRVFWAAFVIAFPLVTFAIFSIAIYANADNTGCIGGGVCTGSSDAVGAQSCRKTVSLASKDSLPFLRHGDQQLDANGKVVSLLPNGSDPMFRLMLAGITQEFQAGKIIDTGHAQTFNEKSGTYYLVEWSIDPTTSTTVFSFYQKTGKPASYQTFKEANPLPKESLRITASEWTFTASDGSKAEGKVRF